MDKAYFKEYYTQERAHWWFLARLQILEAQVQKIGNSEPLKILNIGVATGATTEMLMKYGEVTSLEYDADCCEFLRETVKISVIHGSILELPFEDQSFDLVCAFDVIEHIENDQLGVDEMKRVCKSEGHIFVTVPAFMDLWSQHDVINHHFRRYVKDELTSLFKTTGEITYATYFNSFLFLPIYAARRLSNLLNRNKKEVKSDFERFKPGLSNSLLHSIFLSEQWFINRRWSFPFGVSIQLIWRNTI